MTYALTLRTIREHRKMTRKEVCDKIGISLQHLYYIEKGKRTPSLELLEKLVNHYGVKLELNMPVK